MAALLHPMHILFQSTTFANLELVEALPYPTYRLPSAFSLFR